MGAVGLGGLARQSEVEGPVGLRRVPEQVDQPRRRAAAGQPVQAVVEAPVCRQLPATSRRRGGCATGSSGRFEQSEIGGGRTPDTAPQRVCLEHAPEAIHLLQLRQVELGDRVATPWPVGDETLARQRPQGFSQRNQAHAGALRPGLLVHPLTGSQLSVEDRSA